MRNRHYNIQTKSQTNTTLSQYILCIRIIITRNKWPKILWPLGGTGGWQLSPLGGSSSGHWRPEQSVSGRRREEQFSDTQWGRWNLFWYLCGQSWQNRRLPSQIFTPVVIGLTLHSLDPGDICFYKPEYPFYRVFCSTKKMFSFCPGNKLGLLHYFETLTLNSGKAKTWLKGSSQWDR